MCKQPHGAHYDNFIGQLCTDVIITNPQCLERSGDHADDTVEKQKEKN